MTLAAAVVAAGVSAMAAQQPATMVLKSGSTFSGELVDLGGTEVYFRVNGEGRAIPKGDVASIDFGGGDFAVPDAARNLPAGTHLVILRSGETVQGEFYDLMGASPVRIVFRTPSGERVFEGPEIRRIYMTKAEGGTTSATAATASTGNTRTIVVSSRTRWTSTGIEVRRGDELRFETTGEIVFSPRGHVAHSAGSVDNLFDSNAPIPRALQGALIGRIATGRASSAPFGIGNLTSVNMPADGTLFLSVNDSGLNDNSGEFTVKITK
jgi:hypothetical protein